MNSFCLGNASPKMYMRKVRSQKKREGMKIDKFPFPVNSATPDLRLPTYLPKRGSWLPVFAATRLTTC